MMTMYYQIENISKKKLEKLNKWKCSFTMFSC